jgi:cob(I)alamin adenosyltransferase
MPIYTRTGDKGTTSLITRERVWKSSIRVETYGTIDELNAVLGVIASFLESSPLSEKDYISEILATIQNDLFFVGSYFANPGQKDIGVDLNAHTKSFEKKIDEMTTKMPELANFILPGGGVVGSHFHLARTVARRAERQVVRLLQEDVLEDSVIKYINRLSDLFFTLARFANFVEGKKEIKWKK